MFQQVADFPAWRKPVHPARERRTHQLSQATGHHIRPQKRTDGISQIETEADTLGTWALRWEAAEAKGMRERISFTYSLTNLTNSIGPSDGLISRTRINNLF